MFVARRQISEAIKGAEPVYHQAGSILTRWAQWPYRVRLVLLENHYVDEVPDVESTPSVGTDVDEAIADEVAQAAQQVAVLIVCPHAACNNRAFATERALKRHLTMSHTDVS